MEAVGALTSTARVATKLLGQAFGYGLETDIAEAYASVVEFYEEGDRPFLFGFSHGACTVRAVASLLHMFGLIRHGQESLVLYAIRMLGALNRQSRRAEARALFELAGRFKEIFVGLWDTVSSVAGSTTRSSCPSPPTTPPSGSAGTRSRSTSGVPYSARTFGGPPIRRSRPARLTSGRSGSPASTGMSAAAIQKPRASFSKFALEWMASEAHKTGLLIDRRKLALVMGRAGGGYAPADPDARMHESLRGLWVLAEFVPKRVDWPPERRGRRMNPSRRRLPDAPLVHESAFLRRGYQPPPAAIRVRTDPIA